MPSTSTHEHAHPHEHSHQHDHDHDHPAENYSARTHPEFVVMNIGAGIGGMIIHTDPELHGREIEISATGADDERTHKDVLERSIGGTPAFTAVFDGIPEGSYTFWSEGEPRQRDVPVVGGEIGELDWRTGS